MTLESGDQIFFETGTGRMTLWLLSKANLEHRQLADVVVLDGADVARFIDSLWGVQHAVVVEKGRPDTSWLKVDASGATSRARLTGDGNEVVLTVPERSLLMEAVKSRAWKLFQLEAL